MRVALQSPEVERAHLRSVQEALAPDSVATPGGPGGVAARAHLDICSVMAQPATWES